METPRGAQTAGCTALQPAKDMWQLTTLVLYWPPAQRYLTEACQATMQMFLNQEREQGEPSQATYF